MQNKTEQLSDFYLEYPLRIEISGLLHTLAAAGVEITPDLEKELFVLTEPIFMKYIMQASREIRITLMKWLNNKLGTSEQEIESQIFITNPPDGEDQLLLLKQNAQN
jgi:hypothetical protein